MIKKLTYFLTFVSAFSAFSLKAQLTVNGGNLLIQSGAVITVQGDVTGSVDILGPGKLLLQGSANQNVNMNGFTIPVLEVDNAAGITLTGNTRIGTSLTFTNGKIQAVNFNFTLADVATFSGAGAGKFIETNGTGQVFKEVTANITSNQIPVGAGTSYRPAFLTTTSGSYTNAKIGVRVLAAADPNRPPKLSDYINVYWPITKTGIPGTVTVAGQYIDPTDITTGSEANLKGYYFNGTDWSSASETHNAGTNQISAPITAASGDLTALDKFDLLKAKVFLQGAYNSITGVMSDALRTPTNYIPLSDPYRTAPYNASFTHVANTIPEVAAGGVFANHSSTSDDIVDWVFLELRNNATSGNAVLETRSALIQRDGNIVDIDGISPVTFNNTNLFLLTNFTIAVRHRNHLGLSTNPSTYTPALGETKSTATLVDLTAATGTQLFGSSSGAYTIASDGKNLLWAGNANFNSNVKFNGLGNDKDYILVNTLSNNSGSTLNGVYLPADVNMNGNVKYNGLGNDKDYIFVTVLASNAANIRTQQLPN